MAIISRRIFSTLHRELVIDSLSLSNELVLHTDILCDLQINNLIKIVDCENLGILKLFLIVRLKPTETFTSSNQQR